MPIVEPPALPRFLRAHLPFERLGYRLERGEDAGRRLHLIDHGPRTAQPVLLVHGNPTWSFLWRKVIRLLPEHRAVAPDLLGLGFSDRLPRVADHSLERHVDAVTELVEALELDRLILVGQDWGGPVVTGVGARLPERIAGLVLGNTSILVPKRPRGTWFHRFSRMPVVSEIVFRGLGFPQIALHVAQGDKASIRGEVARAYRWPLGSYRARVAPLAMARMVPDGPEHPSVPELGRGEAWARAFEGPVELVWGHRDPILGRALKRHREAFPGAPVTETMAGHFLQEEVPVEIAAAIRQTAGRSR